MSYKQRLKPPGFIPAYCPALKGTGPQFIKQYINLFVYIWTVRGTGFWMYVTDVNNNVLYGYVWHRSRPRHMRIAVSKIDCLY